MAGIRCRDPYSGTNYIGEGGLPISVKTLDGLNLNVNFLKIDVEGYEPNVLRGARETIKRCKPIIVMEANHEPEKQKSLPTSLKQHYTICLHVPS